MHTATLPADIRLTQRAAALLFKLALWLLLAAGLLWAARQPRFAFQHLQLEGQVLHHDAASVRTQVLPHLTGGFFTADLREVRQAFLALPWVREAVARRVWPGRLVVQLQEHQPKARWISSGKPIETPDDEADEDQPLPGELVSPQGVVFKVPLDDLRPLVDLPEFEGAHPDAAATMVAMYDALLPVLAPLHLGLLRLTRTDQGSWRVLLSNQAVMELGRGSQAEIITRVSAFVRTVNTVRSQRPQDWDRADLRHADGYALHFFKAKSPLANSGTGRMPAATATH